MMRVFRDLEIRRLVVALLFAPVLLYSFFSAHTMPRFTDRGVDIIICTGDGFDALAPGDDTDGDRLPSPCDWSMQVHAAMLPMASPAAEPAALAFSQAVAFEQTILRSGKINPGRFARAPPLFL